MTYEGMEIKVDILRIATGCGLDDRESRVRVPVRSTLASSLYWLWDPPTHPVGTGALSAMIRWLGRERDQSFPTTT
jgi:hypothetical protein